MIVFITGASAGFGAEMARTFVRNGHQVVMAARRMERLDALAPSWANRRCRSRWT
jgi:3-hydroxy acid dehydrogenase/malonic semialdehyde reductase